MAQRLLNHCAALLLAACLASPFAGAETLPAPAADEATAGLLRERALGDGGAYKIVESLTTEVGARPAGSDADARAVAWAVAKFRALGYDKVYTEPSSSRLGAGCPRAPRSLRPSRSALP